MTFSGHFECALARADDVDCVGVLAQGAADETGDTAFVFNDQDSHGNSDYMQARQILDPIIEVFLFKLGKPDEAQ
jgi:hypothetical protein